MAISTITIACHKMMNESRKKNYLARQIESMDLAV